ncbi:hypothetical protein WICMUC_003939 [Wickerhamomyces mucosus]|uniref:Conserved oligomeric Golgi complex subunit 5 n=1 Tax=Wickerhamomyces mucosus TaxID=1378264 RepID=A0A9P8TCA5_9ASCO|nr:hypothetical protein WICMUC_003939 [Wickerhamomyces mucosus]
MSVDEYEDVIDPSFDPITFSNDLLLATNSTPNELDLSTSIKRINFDIQNIDLQLDKISGEEHENLVQEIHQDVNSKQLLSQLSEPLNHINTSFQRLDKDLIKPYNDSIKLQDALKKIHSTAYLLRGVETFTQIIEQIEEISNSKNFDSTILKNNKTLLKLSNLYQNLQSHIDENSNLKSLKIIRDYETIAKSRKNHLIDLLINFIKQINEKTKLNENELSTLLQSLYILDSKSLIGTISSIINVNITVSSNLLIRSLNSPRSFDSTFKEVSNKGLLISKISQSLSVLKINEDKSLLNFILAQLELIDLLSTFWRDIAKNFGKKFKETYNKNTSVGKLLAQNKSQFKKSIHDAVINSDVLGKFDENSIELRMMINSVSALDK